MIARITAALILLLSTPAFALDYEAMGSVTATVDGTEMEFCVPYLVEEGDAHAEITGPVKSMGILSVDGFTCRDGDLYQPRLALSVFRPGPSATGSGLELWTSDGLYMVEEGNGSLQVTDFKMSGDHVSFAFEATAVAYDRTSYMPKDGAAPVSVSGQVDVELRQ
ncbi:hypothetical protein [Amorphus sp. 3PC139-8]|uniref:hypothetical protein n=1 Tax=Amorphus sp. 3PC139-8 TaxID=2735676 RepID=UPI00345E01CE